MANTYVIERKPIDQADVDTCAYSQFWSHSGWVDYPLCQHYANKSLAMDVAHSLAINRADFAYAILEVDEYDMTRNEQEV